MVRPVGVGRSSLYYRPKGESAENLALMRRMDELHMNYPFYGSRQMMRHLRREGCKAGRHRIRRLMRLMGVEAVYRRPRTTSAAGPEHRVFPYLLRGLDVSRANHMWCADITYIPVSHGFFYLVAVTDILFQKLLAAADRWAERDGVDLLVLFSAGVSVSKALDAFAAAAGPEDMGRLAWSFRHPEKMSWPSSSRWARFARQVEEHEPGGLNPSHWRIEGPERIEPLTPASSAGRPRTL